MTASATGDLTLLGSYCRLHDADAFDALVDRYEAELLRLACAFLADAHLAMDVVQDAFIALARKAALVWQQAQVLQQQGARDTTLRPWLYRVVRNGCIDRIRRQRPEQLLAEEFGDGARAVADRLDERERAELLWQRVDGLSPLQRAAVVLRYREGCSYQDIAERLGRTVNHVGVLLNKALARLRTCPQLRAEVSP